ncbi:MAG: DUF2254 domain-containing protein [Alphaproteobacteria bacterium]|nr:DUF2254 domain-containing protein [Alphaproteobacteria bacterium]
MLLKIYNYWQLLKSNLWFVPAAFCIGFLAFTASLYYVEITYLHDLEYPSFLFQGSTDDAKSVTIALMSAMITMATLAISITMVVLSLAASQLGPRLIRSFMSDQKTKDFIGLFFGAVMACFVLTIILHSRGSQMVTPQLTISVVFVICAINLFIFLGFVHHVAQSSIADNVILKVSNDLKSALNRLTKDIIKKRYEASKDNGEWPKDFEQMSTRIVFERSGYVQNIDYDAIMDIACNHDLRVRVDFKAGRYIVEGEDGLRIYSKVKDKTDDIEKRIKNTFIIGNQHTATQDISYSIRHLVEIAIRALSPGINDSFTAMSVLDHLSGALAILFEKETPAEDFYDDEGIKRMHAKQSDEADIILSAFDQIRFHGRGTPSMIRHLLKKFKPMAELAKDKATKTAIIKQLNAIAHDLKTMNDSEPDIEDLRIATDELIAALKQE